MFWICSLGEKSARYFNESKNFSLVVNVIFVTRSNYKIHACKFIDAGTFYVQLQTAEIMPCVKETKGHAGQVETVSNLSCFIFVFKNNHVSLFFVSFLNEKHICEKAFIFTGL